MWAELLAYGPSDDVTVCFEYGISRTADLKTVITHGLPIKIQ